MKIIKRNGQEAIFDEVKITNAIIGANKEVVETERLSEEEIDNILDLFNEDLQLENITEVATDIT